jgi:two-component system response regulator FixJ
MDAETSAEQATDIRVPRIAVIDDDNEFRTSLCAFMQSAGLWAIGFATAEVFLAAREQVDCIVCDFQMPGHMDGLQLLRAVKALGHATPVIVMSAFGDDALIRRAKGEGAHCFLEKPVMIDALLKCIRSATSAEFSS